MAELFKKWRQIPACRRRRKADPTGSQGLAEERLSQPDARFRKAQWVLQLQLEITTTLPGVLVGHQTMHQGSQQGRTGTVTTGDKHLNDKPHFKYLSVDSRLLKSAYP